MKNKYLDYITDEHFLSCIANLYKAYQKAKEEVNLKSFYNNKVDTIKLTLDASFNVMNEEQLIQAEVLRQMDKSINNSIGTFHEHILGGIEGYEKGNLSGFDIKAKDDSLFALFDTDVISKKFEYCIFEGLTKQANLVKKSSCFFVDFYPSNSYSEKWIINNGEFSVSHKRVFKISIDKFYAVLTGREKAFDELKSILPMATQEYLEYTKNLKFHS
jgi:hypothetical protein